MKNSGIHAFSKGRNMTLLIVFIIGLLLMPKMNILAQDAKTLAKEINQAVRNSQRMMFNGKFEESQKYLDTAAELLEKLKEIDPEFNQLKSLEGKYARQKKDLDKRLGKTQPAKPSTTTQPQKPGAKGDADKLPGGVTHRLKSVDRILQKGDRALAKKSAASDDWKVKQLDSILQEANDMMDEIQKGYGDQIPSDHPDMKARQEKIAAFQTAVDEYKGNVTAQAKKTAEENAQREAQSQEWLTKIKPYITGHISSGQESKFLIAAGTADVEELKLRKAIYDEAAALFAEYEKATFPYGKTEELERAEKDLSHALKSFREGYKESVDGFFAKAEEKLAYTEQWLSQQEKKSDEKTGPLTLQKDIIPDIQKLIATAAASTSEDDSRVIEFKQRLAAIEQKNRKFRNLHIEQTVMKPDQFTGKELKGLKAKAEAILSEEHGDAKVLRTTIISPDWKEEDVVEFTDTTKTTVRHRITHSVTAQVAGKRGDEVFLYTIYLAKNKKSDGSWGSLYGHIMFTDPMLEENVNK